MNEVGRASQAALGLRSWNAAWEGSLWEKRLPTDVGYCRMCYQQYELDIVERAINSTSTESVQSTADIVSAATRQ